MFDPELFRIPSRTSRLFIFKPSHQEFPLRKRQNKRHIRLPGKSATVFQRAEETENLVGFLTRMDQFY